MEKTLAVTERAKGSNPIVIQFPMLTATNYTVWAKRMTVTLRCHKVWDVIEPGVDDEDKNNSAIALLFQSIPESLILQLDHDKAKDLWEAIKNRYLGANRVREARLQTLSSEFEKLTMTESEDIEGFAGRISSIASRSSALGQNIEEQKMVKKILNGVPKNKYIQLVASLEQVLDLSTTTFEDIVGRLKAYEERIRVDDQSSDQGNLLFTSNSQNSRERFGEPRGRGRGNHGRGRGRGRGVFNDNREQKQSEVICWRCDKPGHVVYNCPDRPRHGQETNLVEAEETQEADIALYMHEIVLTNEEDELEPVTPMALEDRSLTETNRAVASLSGRLTTQEENVREPNRALTELNRGKSSVSATGCTSEARMSESSTGDPTHHQRPVNVNRVIPLHQRPVEVQDSLEYAAEDTEVTEEIGEFPEIEENYRDIVGTSEDPFQQPDKPRLRRSNRKRRARMKFKMKRLIGIRDLRCPSSKIKGENVGDVGLISKLGPKD